MLGGMFGIHAVLEILHTWRESVRKVSRRETHAQYVRVDSPADNLRDILGFLEKR